MVTLIEVLSQLNINTEIIIQYPRKLRKKYHDEIFTSVSDMLNDLDDVYTLYRDLKIIDIRDCGDKTILYLNKYIIGLRDEKYKLNQRTLDLCYMVCSNAIKNGNLKPETAYSILGKSIQEFEINSAQTEYYGCDHVVSTGVIEWIALLGCRDSAESYAQGLSYHFAEMLKERYGGGEIVLDAPRSHMCWMATNGNVYDIKGASVIHPYRSTLFIPIDHMRKSDVKRFTSDNKDPHRTPTLNNIELTMLKYDKFLCSKYNYKF